MTASPPPQAQAQQHTTAALPMVFTDVQRLHLQQAIDMLDDYAAHREKHGEDSLARGAEASRYVLASMLTTPPPPADARMCLVCGATAPCMTEADLKPGDPGVPCTFDPTPQELFDDNRRLRNMLTEARGSEALRDLLWALDSNPSCQAGAIDRCKCRCCASDRARAALAASQAAPAQQETPK